MKKNSKFALFMFALLTCHLAGNGNLKAQNYSFSNDFYYEIPDFNEGGISSPINVTGIPVGAEIIDIWVSAKIGHTYVGDLSIWLVSPDGSTRIGLMERPGVPNADFGYSSDLSIDNTYSFLNDATESSELMGQAEHYGGNGGIVPTSEWSPSWDEVLAPPAYNDFPTFISVLPDDINGTWTLHIRDSAEGDTGVFQNFVITFFTNSMATTEFNEKSFEIYPNPVTDILNIQSQLPIDQIAIYELSGKMVMIQKNQNQIHVNQLPTGTYFAVISSGIKKETIQFIKK